MGARWGGNNSVPARLVFQVEILAMRAELKAIMGEDEFHAWIKAEYKNGYVESIAKKLAELKEIKNGE